MAITLWCSSSLDDTAKIGLILCNQKLDLVLCPNGLAGQQITRSDRSSDKNRSRTGTLAARNRSHSTRSLFAQRRRCRCCLKHFRATYFDTSFLKNTCHIIHDICKRCHFDGLCLCSMRTLSKKEAISLQRKVWSVDIRKKCLKVCSFAFYDLRTDGLFLSDIADQT